MNKVALTEKQVETITSYADGAERIIRELGIDRFALNDALLDFNVERCPYCGWYDESSAMIGDEGDEPDGYCDNCRRYKKQV